MDPFLQTARLLQSDLTLSDFVHWFNASWWRWDSEDDGDRSDFIARLESRIYELTSGWATEADFRRAVASDIEIFSENLRSRPTKELDAFLNTAIQRFLSAEITFNDLLGRAEYVLAVAGDRSDAGDLASAKTLASRARRLQEDLIDSAKRQAANRDIERLVASQLTTTRNLENLVAAESSGVSKK